MRKKKTLLKETTIRRFMKLANMEPLQETYFDQYGLSEQPEELEMGEEEEVEELPPEGMEPGMEGGEEEVEVEDEVELGGVEGGDVDEAAIKDLVDTIATAIEDKYDIPISVEGGEGGAPEEEVEFEEEEVDELPEEPGMEGGEELGGAEGEMPPPEEELMELLSAAGIEVVDDGPMVQEVVKRVAKRLIKEKMGVRHQPKRRRKR